MRCRPIWSASCRLSRCRRSVAGECPTAPRCAGPQFGSSRPGGVQPVVKNTRPIATSSGAIACDPCFGLSGTWSTTTQARGGEAVDRSSGGLELGDPAQNVAHHYPVDHNYMHWTCVFNVNLLQTMFHEPFHAILNTRTSEASSQTAEARSASTQQQSQLNMSLTVCQ